MNARTIDREQTESFVDYRKVMLTLLVIASIFAAGVWAFNRPKTFTLDEKHWSCIETEPNGIEAVCTNFAKKKPVGFRTQ